MSMSLFSGTKMEMVHLLIVNARLRRAHERNRQDHGLTHAVPSGQGLHTVASPGELEARVDAKRPVILQVHQAAQRSCVRIYERLRPVLLIDALAETVGGNIPVEVMEGEPVEVVLPLELLGELRARERVRSVGAVSGFAAQEVPRLADQASIPHYQVQGRPKP